MKSLLQNRDLLHEDANPEIAEVPDHLAPGEIQNYADNSMNSSFQSYMIKENKKSPIVSIKQRKRVKCSSRNVTKNAKTPASTREACNSERLKVSGGPVPGTSAKKKKNDYQFEKATKGLSIKQDYKYVKKYQTVKKKTSEQIKFQNQRKLTEESSNSNQQIFVQIQNKESYFPMVMSNDGLKLAKEIITRNKFQRLSNLTTLNQESKALKFSIPEKFQTKPPVSPIQVTPSNEEEKVKETGQSLSSRAESELQQDDEVVYEVPSLESSRNKIKLPILSKSIESPARKSPMPISPINLIKTRGFIGSNRNKHFIRNEKLNLILSMDARSPKNRIELPEIAINFKSPDTSITHSKQCSSPKQRVSATLKNLPMFRSVNDSILLREYTASPTEINICKAINLENALKSRKLATTKYLHTKNIYRNSKMSNMTKKEPRDIETPSQSVMNMQPFGNIDIMQSKGIDLQNPQFEERAAQALATFVHNEESVSKSRISVSVTGGDNSRSRQVREIYFPEPSKPQQLDEKDLLSPIMQKASSAAPNYTKHTNSSMNARQDQQNQQKKNEGVFKLDAMEEPEIDLLVDGQSIARYDIKNRKYSNQLVVNDTPVAVQRDVVLTQRANPINVIIPQNAGESFQHTQRIVIQKASTTDSEYLDQIEETYQIEHPGSSQTILQPSPFQRVGSPLNIIAEQQVTENLVESPEPNHERNVDLQISQRRAYMISTSKNSSEESKRNSPAGSSKHKAQSFRKTLHPSKTMNIQDPSVVINATVKTNSRMLKGKFPSKSIVPISGNKGIVNYRHMRELQELKSNYSRDSGDDDKLSQTFIQNPRMHQVLQDIKLYDEKNSRNQTIKEMKSTKRTIKLSTKGSFKKVLKQKDSITRYQSNYQAIQQKISPSPPLLVTESIGIQADITRNSFYDHTQTVNSKINKPGETQNKWILDQEKLPYHKKQGGKISPKPNAPVQPTNQTSSAAIANTASSNILNQSVDITEPQQTSLSRTDTIPEQPIFYINSSSRFVPFQGISNPLYLSQTLIQTQVADFAPQKTLNQPLSGEQLLAQQVKIISDHLDIASQLKQYETKKHIKVKFSKQMSMESQGLSPAFDMNNIYHDLDTKGLQMHKIEQQMPKKKKKKNSRFNMSQLPFDQAFRKLEKNRVVGQSYPLTKEQSLSQRRQIQAHYNSIRKFIQDNGQRVQFQFDKQSAELTQGLISEVVSERAAPELLDPKYASQKQVLTPIPQEDGPQNLVSSNSAAPLTPWQQ